TVIAHWLGVTPAAVSQWHTGKRPIHPRYGPVLRLRARTTLAQAWERTAKEVATAPTPALGDAIRAEFDALYVRWKEQVLFDGGTLLKQLHQQYYALGGWVLQEVYRPDDVESFRLVTAAMAQQMERLITLQGKVPSAEDALHARLTAA